MSNLENTNEMKRAVSGFGMIICLVGSIAEAVVDLSQDYHQNPRHTRTQIGDPR